MKRLYYVRHGESVINVNKIWGSRAAGPLTALGRQQARAAGQKAKEDQLQIDLVVSSPTERAKETAEIITKGIGYPQDKIILSDLLLERGVGEIEGTSFDEFFRNHTYQELDTIPGAETIAQLHERAKKAHEYLLSLPQENIMVVSHSAFGRALRRIIMSRPHSDEYVERASLPHAEILIWTEED